LTTGRQRHRFGVVETNGISPVVWLIAALPLALGVFVATRDQYFRDELYFVAAGRHLDLGYVDFPMMTAWLAALSGRLFGESLPGLRLVPALAGGVTILLTALIAREMGGGRDAQWLAALAALSAPVFLAGDTLFGPDVIDRVLWIAGALVLAVMLRRDQPRWWLAFGVITALGLLTKLTMPYFASAVVLGLLVTGRWRHVFTPWAPLAGLVALAGLAPYVVWQMRHAWPTLEFFAHYGGKLADLSPRAVVAQQVLNLGPVTLPLWLGGLGFLLAAHAARPFRPLGIVFLALLIVFAVMRAKSYFLAPAYPMLLAAGAVALSRSRVGRRALVPYAVAVAATAIVMIPVATPALGPAASARMFGGIGAGAVRQEKSPVTELPQYLADRYGWPEMVATIASAYHALPDDERREACILVSNYGRAAAIDFYGPRHGLPNAISGHNNYYLWGPRGCTGRVVIATGFGEPRLQAMFERVERVATITCRFCMPTENDVPVYVAHRSVAPFESLWPALKHYE
jgi:4-amino-4-deoxy-L-arabinose transferase-like glycosyltransferase